MVYFSFGRVSVSTLDTAPGLAIKADVAWTTVGEFGLLADVAHVTSVYWAVALFALLRYVAYRMALLQVRRWAVFRTILIMILVGLVTVVAITGFQSIF